MLAAAAARGHRRLVQASAEALPFSPGRFDTVLCAFYTLRDLERSKVYTEVARVLRPGGILAFTLRSYYTAYLETLWREFLQRGRRPRSWWRLDGADGVERDLWDVKAEVAALESAGLRLQEIRSVRFLPFLRRWLHPGFWRGERTAAFGTDVIFVAEKPIRRPEEPLPRHVSTWARAAALKVGYKTLLNKIVAFRLTPPLRR
jgi:SAM-dependent methyltransferase